MGSELAINFLRNSLAEFRTVDKRIFESGNFVSEILTQFIEESGIVFTDDEQQLLRDMREQYDILREDEDFWKNIIDDDILEASADKVSATLVNINSMLGNPDSNVAYKKRLRACFLLTQNQSRLEKIIKENQRFTSNPSVLMLGSNPVDADLLSLSISRPFQFLPRQTLFVNDWCKKVEEGQLSECREATRSLSRKYQRAAKLLNQTMAAVQACKDGIIDQNIFISVNQSAITSAMEATPFKKQKKPAPAIATSSFATPQKNSFRRSVIEDQLDSDLDDDMKEMLEHSEYTNSSDRDSLDSNALLLDDNMVQLAKEICAYNARLETPINQKRAQSLQYDRKLFSPTRKLNFNLLDAETPKIIKLSYKNETAQQSIINLEYILSTSHRPTLFGGGSKYEMKNGETIKVPHHEKKIRDMLDSFNPKKLRGHHRLASGILNTAISAESSKPLLNSRSNETTNFYQNMFETLGVDVNASINNIKNFIKDNKQEYWGTRWHKRPSTVAKIYAIIKDDTKTPRERLKEVIYLAQVAAETNGNMSMFGLRSEKTESFYSRFTQKFIKFDKKLIYKSYVGDKPETTDEAEVSTPPRQKN